MIHRPSRRTSFRPWTTGGPSSGAALPWALGDGKAADDGGSAEHRAAEVVVVISFVTALLTT